MKFLRRPKGCTKLDRYKNEDVRNKLNPLPIRERINNIELVLSNQLNRLDKGRFPKHERKETSVDQEQD